MNRERKMPKRRYMNGDFDGQTIKRRRKQLGITQTELAEGVTTQATISLIENENRVPGPEVLFAVLERLNLDVSDFVSGDVLLNKAKALANRVIFEDDAAKACQQFIRYAEDLRNNVLAIQEYYILNAAVAFQVGDYEAAAINLEQLVDHEKLDHFHHFYVTYRLGVIDALLGDIKEAQRYYTLAANESQSLNHLEEEAYHVVLRFQLDYAQFLMAQNELEKSWTLLNEAVTSLRERSSLYLAPELYQQLAAVNHQLGHETAARESERHAQEAFYFSGRRTL
jgi:transcriptional regulator with XRE-family HTH domain